MRKQHQALFVLASVAIGFLSSLSPAEAALKKVTLLQQIGNVDVRDAPWAVAQEMGWLAEAGVELEVQSTKGAAIVVQQISSGNSQYAMASPETALIAHTRGAPLKFYYASTTRNPFPLAVLADGPVKNLRDLKGKTIGLFSMTGIQFYTTQAIMLSVGYKLREDYQFVEVGAGPAALKALRGGEIAALATNIFNYAGFENRGVKFNYLTSKEVEPVFAWSLMTNADYLKQNTKEAIGVARAFAKGNVYCQANPESCIRIFLKRFPTMRTPGISEGQLIADQVKIFGKFLEYAAPAPGHVIGWYDPAAWKNVVSYMVTSGQLPAAIDPEPIYTNEFLDEIDNFDRKAVQSAKPPK